MKLCTKCNKKFDDNSNFCDECGGQLVDFEIKYCSKCGCQCTSLDTFCKNCGNPLSGKNSTTIGTSETISQNQSSTQTETPPQAKPVTQPTVQPQIKPIPSHNKNNFEHSDINDNVATNKNNNALLVAIIGVLAILLAVIIIIFVKLDLFPSFKSVTSDKDISSEQTQNDNRSGSENKDNSENTTDDALDLSSYQNYYDNIDDVFNKLIISSSQKGELKSYKNSLNDAIKSNNQDNCQYNYDKLLDLEKTLKEDSKSEIKKLTDKIKKYEKKEK